MATLFLKEGIDFLTIDGKKVYKEELIKRANELSENGYAHYFYTQDSAKKEPKTETAKQETTKVETAKKK